YLQFGEQVAPGGYAWLFPKGPGVANVGLGLVALKADGRNARQYLDGWIARRYPGGAKTAHTVGGVIVHTTIKATYTDGVLLAGDAAHMINPLSGGGIVNAMKAGRLAGQTAAAAICAGDTGAGRLSAYHAAWMELLGDDHLKYYRIKRALEEVDDAFFNSLARTVNAIPLEKRTLGRIFVHGHVASGPEHPPQPARARQDRRLAPHARRLAAAVREDLSARRGLRHPDRRAGRDPRQQALQRCGRLLGGGTGAAPGAGPGRATARHRRPFARQRPRSQEAAARDQPTGVPGGRERERLFAGVAGRPAGAADAVGRIVPLAHLPGERARGPRLRRRDVLGQGGARERHAHPRVRSGAQVRRAREHDLGGSTRLPRRQRHREDREDGRLLRGERAAPGAAYGPRGRDHGRLPGELVRKRDHRGHHLRRQGI